MFQVSIGKRISGFNRETGAGFNRGLTSFLDVSEPQLNLIRNAYLFVENSLADEITALNKLHDEIQLTFVQFGPK